MPPPQPSSAHSGAPHAALWSQRYTPSPPLLEDGEEDIEEAEPLETSLESLEEGARGRARALFTLDALKDDEDEEEEDNEDDEDDRSFDPDFLWSVRPGAPRTPFRRPKGMTAPARWPCGRRPEPHRPKTPSRRVVGRATLIGPEGTRARGKTRHPHERTGDLLPASLLHAFTNNPEGAQPWQDNLRSRVWRCSAISIPRAGRTRRQTWRPGRHEESAGAATAEGQHRRQEGVLRLGSATRSAKPACTRWCLS